MVVRPHPTPALYHPEPPFSRSRISGILHLSRVSSRDQEKPFDTGLMGPELWEEQGHPTPACPTPASLQVPACREGQRRLELCRQVAPKDGSHVLPHCPGQGTVTTRGPLSSPHQNCFQSLPFPWTTAPSTTRPTLPAAGAHRRPTVRVLSAGTKEGVFREESQGHEHFPGRRGCFKEVPRATGPSPSPDSGHNS